LRGCLGAKPVRVQVILGETFESYAVDFARGIERHRIEEDNLLRRLVSNPVAAEQNQIGTGKALSVLP
jgi:hypothetical protein